MHPLFSRIALVLAMVLGGMSAAAGAEKRDVPANKTSPVFFFFTYDRFSCAFGSKPAFKVNIAPEHGTVTSKWFGFRMAEDTGKCRGKPVKGTLVTYTPHKGFRGKDRVRFSLIGSGIYPGAGYSLSRSYTVDINVK